MWGAFNSIALHIEHFRRADRVSAPHTPPPGVPSRATAPSASRSADHRPESAASRDTPAWDEIRSSATAACRCSLSAVAKANQLHIPSPSGAIAWARSPGIGANGERQTLNQPSGLGREKDVAREFAPRAPLRRTPPGRLKTRSCAGIFRNGETRTRTGDTTIFRGGQRAPFAGTRAAYGRFSGPGLKPAATAGLGWIRRGLGLRWALRVLLPPAESWCGGFERGSVGAQLNRRALRGRPRLPRFELYRL